MYHSLPIHLPSKGHLGYFEVLEIMSKAAIHFYVQVFLLT